MQSRQSLYSKYSLLLLLLIILQVDAINAIKLEPIKVQSITAEIRQSAVDPAVRMAINPFKDNQAELRVVSKNICMDTLKKHITYHLHYNKVNTKSQDLIIYKI